MPAGSLGSVAWRKNEKLPAKRGKGGGPSARCAWPPKRHEGGKEEGRG